MVTNCYTVFVLIPGQSLAIIRSAASNAVRCIHFWVCYSSFNCVGHLFGKSCIEVIIII